MGAGRLGTALAIALREERYTIEAVVARRQRSARNSVALLDVPARALAAKDLPLISAKGSVIVATPDDQIETVVRRIARVSGNENGRVILHTSGALSSLVLRPLRDHGWHVGSIHPLIAVSEPRAGASALHGAYWCVEGDKQAIRVARAIVDDLEGRSFSVSSDLKALYHAAAVMASGNVVALFDVATEMLNRCGLTRKEAQQVLLPLTTSAVTNMSRSTPEEALTGTFARGDEATVELHLQALSQSGLETAHELYRILGRRSIELALRGRADKQALQRIRRKLEK